MRGFFEKKLRESVLGLMLPLFPPLFAKFTVAKAPKRLWMDKFYARLAVGSLFFLHGFCFSTWGVRIPTIQDKLALSEAELGSILFSLPIGSILSMPLAVGLVSRKGSRRVLTLAILLYAAL